MTTAPVSARLGRYVETTTAGETVRAYVPPPLPPTPPPDLARYGVRYGDAALALGRLDGISHLVRDTGLFIDMYVRKEAVLSSQIEGTQSSLDDLLRFELEPETGAAFDDVREVSNYVDAMRHGLDRLATLPLSLRLIREVHAKLMAGGRGGSKGPGEFRITQNWVGGSRPGNAVFVPPPPHELAACLDAFETYLHDESDATPPLVKAGLAHVQFETIHPFLDGNGRVGRLLITLMLCQKGLLAQPLLYLSLYFKERRADYYRLLQEVRERGAWEDWLEFYLEGVASTAEQAFQAATRIVALFERDRERLRTAPGATSAVLRIHELLQARPFVTVRGAEAATGLAFSTVNAALAALVELGLVREVTGKRRGRIYAYSEYLAILGEGTGRPL